VPRKWSYAVKPTAYDIERQRRKQMGRPLNKKYFGNRNVGADGNFGSANTAGDAGLGGQEVSGVTNVIAGTYTSAQTLLFPRPLLEGNGGVRATGTPTYKVISATISGGTNYGNAQTFNLTVNTAAGSAVLNVTSTAGGAITTVNSITTAGTFTDISAVTSVSGGAGTGAVPVLTYGLLGATITNPGSGYLGQSFATTSITAATASGNVVTVASTSDLVPGTKLVVTGTTIGNIVAGTYFVLTVASSTTLTIANSYANFFGGTPFACGTGTGSMTAVASQHLDISLGGGGSVVMTSVLTTAPTTSVGTSAGNAFPSIIATAFISTKAIELTDIVKQEGARRYKVKNSDGTGYVNLVDGTSALVAGQMTIKATDSAGGTYWVTKLTGHKATLVPNTGTQFPLVAGLPQAVQWTLSTPTANVTVQIDNG
jgi:hypothetical protein